MFAVSNALAAAQMQATLDRMSTGGGAAALHLYTTARPPTPQDDPGGAAQAVIALSSPPGVVTDGVLSLTPAVPEGTLVLADGIPRWGRFFAADGAPMADGDVTDDTHGGDITVGGGLTPDGDTSPLLYAGGLVLLGTVALT